MPQLAAAVQLSLLLLLACIGQSQAVVDAKNCQQSEVYSAAKGAAVLVWLDRMLERNTSCTTALVGLKHCANDSSSLNTTGSSNRSAVSSLVIKEGCCSARCATAIDQALIASGPGCYRSFLEAACNTSGATLDLTDPLLGLAKKCIGLNATCAALNTTGSLLPPELEALAANYTGSLPVNSTADSTTSSTASITFIGIASPAPGAGAVEAVEAASATEAGETPEAASAAGAEAAPVLPDVSVPDPYGLLPQASPGDVDTSVLLATPDEIVQALATPGRRMLASSAVRRRSR